MSLEQPTILLTTDTTEDTAPGAVLVFPLPVGVTSADLLPGQTVYLEVYGRAFDGLAVDLSAPDAVSVTWAADAPYPLPPGEYNVAFQTTAPQGMPDDVGQVAAQAPVVLVAQEVDPATIDLPGLATAYNGMVAAHDELATAHNNLVAAMQAANLMAPAAVATAAKRKTKK
jgi:hypothetical protein